MASTIFCQAAGIRAPKCVRRAVLAGHQRQVQRFFAGERRADLQAGAAVALRVHVILGDRQHFVHRLPGFRHQQAVIILVSEAIGSTAWSFFFTSTSPVL
jgi:hypothetical protein